jgi:hypothetical protein
MRALVIAAALCAGCFDFADPSELADVQLLGVRAEPKAIGAGERARLDFIAGGPGGVTETAPATWSVIDDLTFPAVGSIAVEGDQVFYQAPAEIPEPSAVTLQVVVEIDGQVLNALKLVGIGLPPTPNPRLTRVALGGADIEGASTPVVANTVTPLAAELAPADPEMLQIAWYSTVGELDPIRGTETSIEIAAGAETGPLVVVGRDGVGGIDWRVIELLIE